jgi:hypothetical protein
MGEALPRMSKMKNTNKVSTGCSDEKRILEKSTISGDIKLKLVRKKNHGRIRTGFIWLGIGT